MDIWQSGFHRHRRPRPGGSVAGSTAPSSSPLRAVALGPTLPVVLTGERRAGRRHSGRPADPPRDATEQALYARRWRPPVHGRPALLADGGQLERGPPRAAATPRARPSTARRPIRSTSRTCAGRSTAAGALAIANGGGGRPAGDVLAMQLSVVANLILAGTPTDVYSVELGGFDTHADQESTQRPVCWAQLDSAVTSFVDALRRRTPGDKTTMLIYTEFGRRVGRQRQCRHRPRVGQRGLPGWTVGQGRLLR